MIITRIMQAFHGESKVVWLSKETHDFIRQSYQYGLTTSRDSSFLRWFYRLDASFSNLTPSSTSNRFTRTSQNHQGSIVSSALTKNQFNCS